MNSMRVNFELDIVRLTHLNHHSTIKYKQILAHLLSYNNWGELSKPFLSAIILRKYAIQPISIKSREQKIANAQFLS